MDAKLTIRWDGPSESLRSHRLSLNEWLRPLQLLLAAVKRTASSLARDVEDDSYGSKGGSFSAQARSLDLEIVEISDGCVRLGMVVTTTQPQQPMPWDIRLEAVSRLVDDIKAEAEGRPCNFSARAYLNALPSDVAEHDYELRLGDQVLKSTQVGAAHLRELPRAMPRVVRARGSINAVCFEPPSVTLKGPEGRLKGAATRETVEQALRLRSEAVVGTFVVSPDGKRVRLVALRSADDAPASSSADERLHRMLADWPDTLRRLSQ